MNAPCAGQWELFDSTEYHDHEQARKLCNGCPIIDACRQRLEDSRRTSYSPMYGPRGTWAGELMGTNVIHTRRIAAEEQMFSEDDARKAHAHWTRTPGPERPDLPEHVRAGERVYQRRSAQRKRQRQAEAA